MSRYRLERENERLGFVEMWKVEVYFTDYNKLLDSYTILLIIKTWRLALINYRVWYVIVFSRL